MNFGQAISTVFHKYATFSGRARRAEYWWFALLNYLAATIFGSPIVINSVHTGAQFTGANAGLSILQSLIGLVFLIPALAVTWRRLHDVDRSGAWILLSAIPVVGWIALLVLLAKDGDRGPNRFGPDPKLGYQFA